MDDDDGFILNFAPSAPAPPPSSSQAHPAASTAMNMREAAASVKGGWRHKRAYAKKIVRYSGPDLDDVKTADQPIESATAGISDSVGGNAQDDFASVPQKSFNTHKGNPKNKTALKSLKEKTDSHSKPMDAGIKREIMAVRKPAMIHGKKQVISSLFTFNQDVPLPSPPDSPSTPINSNPSNAPLLDSSSFAGLGLNPILTAHLDQKMSIAAPTEIQRLALPHLLIKDQDLIIQAQTGSGKTLTFLMPILHRLIATTLAEERNVSRDIGTLAIILAPTRELARQISSVLETCLNFNPSLPADDPETHRLKKWIVPGLIIGGEKRKSEKARLRKGVNVLVSTPGRLLDHLKSTQSFDVSQIRWTILDEADKLLELGFEQQIREILEIIKNRSNLTAKTFKAWPQRRQMVLCSATMPQTVRTLAEWAMEDPTFIKADNKKTYKNPDGTDMDIDEANLLEDGFVSVPQQLKQHFLMVQSKTRLVTLMYILKHIQRTRPNEKVIVFFGCCDSVEFHHAILSGAVEVKEEEKDDKKGSKDKSKDVEAEKREAAKKEELKKSKSPPVVDEHRMKLSPIFHLHGSLPAQQRQRMFAAFMTSTGGVLLTTDVASRGLDLKDVSTIIQYDPATDMKEYIHRIGRTARVGKSGRAILFLLPHELDYLGMLREKGLELSDYTKIAIESLEEASPSIQLTPEEFLKVLAVQVHSLAAKDAGKTWSLHVTETQLAIERILLSTESLSLLARKAYFAHIRSYATHSSAQKHIFHLKKLHLGHLAKSFGLRETPKDMARVSNKNVAKDRQENKVQSRVKSFQDGAKLSSKATGGVRMTKDQHADSDDDDELFRVVNKKRARPMADVSEFGDGIVGSFSFVPLKKRAKGGR